MSERKHLGKHLEVLDFSEGGIAKERVCVVRQVNFDEIIRKLVLKLRNESSSSYRLEWINEGIGIMATALSKEFKDSIVFVEIKSKGDLK